MDNSTLRLGANQLRSNSNRFLINLKKSVHEKPGYSKMLVRSNKEAAIMPFREKM
jgi:hypothetical protein